MMKRYSVPFCAVLFGVLCAVLDWRSQLNGFLPMLAVPMIICLAILAVCARDYEIHENWRFEEYFAGDDTMLKLLSVVGGLLLALGGAGTIALTALTGSISMSALPQFVLGLLSIASCVSCVVLAKVQAHGKMDESSASATLILLVWAAMHLIVLFKSNNTNPYMVTYLSGLLAAVALTLAFLFYARFLYGKLMPRTFLFLAGAAVLLAFAAGGGYALTALLPGVFTEGANALTFTYHISALGGAVYLVGQMIRMCAPRKQTYFWQD
jgi:hypothetical protein